MFFFVKKYKSEKERDMSTSIKKALNVIITTNMSTTTV